MGGVRAALDRQVDRAVCRPLYVVELLATLVVAEALLYVLGRRMAR